MKLPYARLESEAQTDIYIRPVSPIVRARLLSQTKAELLADNHQALVPNLPQSESRFSALRTCPNGKRFPR